MKLLFLANRTPYPPYRGDKLKIWHLARQLVKRGHELHLLTFAQNEDDYSARPQLESVFTSVTQVALPSWKSAMHCLGAAWDPKPVQVLYFQDAGMRSALDRLLAGHRFDAVHVQHLRMAPYLAANFTLPRILDLPDAFSLYWKRRQSVDRGFFQKQFETLEAARVLRYEPVMQSYELALACSQEDVDYLEATHHTGNVHLLPNGVDLETFYPRDHDYSHNRTLLFTGNMDYAPNVDAVGYFVQDVLPLVRQRHPEVRFVIAGQRPVEAVKKLAGPGVEVTGFIEDLAAKYNEASVVVAPLRFGAGTQNKVLEAMAMGIPVVCSHIGFAGLGIGQGEGAFMHRDPEGFAAAVCELLDRQELREKTGAAGLRVMRERFGWEAIARRLEGYFEAAIAKRES